MKPCDMCSDVRWCGTDRPPGDPLHDEVLAGLQVLDDVFAQRGVGLDEALDDFVEVEGGQVHHVQDPGEANVGLGRVPAACVAVASGLKAAL